MLPKVTLVVFLTILAANSAIGQSLYIVTGRVVGRDGQPIAGADVSLRRDFHVTEVGSSRVNGTFTVSRVLKSPKGLLLFVETPGSVGAWRPFNSSYRALTKLPGVRARSLRFPKSRFLKLGDIKPDVFNKTYEVPIFDLLGIPITTELSMISVTVAFYSGGIELASDTPLLTSAIRDGILYIVLPENSSNRLRFTYFREGKKLTVTHALE